MELQGSWIGVNVCGRIRSCQKTAVCLGVFSKLQKIHCVFEFNLKFFLLFFNFFCFQFVVFPIFLFFRFVFFLFFSLFVSFFFNFHLHIFSFIFNFIVFFSFFSS